MDVAKSISDIYTDPEGNVTIQLLDGRNFYLGNMKGPQGERGLQGEKGEKGDKGDRGPQGIQGPQGPAGASGSNGRDGANGQNGKDGVDGKDGEIPTDYVKDVTIEKSDKMYVTYGDGTKTYVDRVSTKGKYKIVPVYHIGDREETEPSEKDAAYTWADEGQSVVVGFYTYETGDSIAINPGDAKYRLEKAMLGDTELELTYRDQYSTNFLIESMPGNDATVDFYYLPYAGCFVPSDGATYDEVAAWYYEYENYIDYLLTVQTDDETLINTFVVTKQYPEPVVMQHGSKLEEFSSDLYTIVYYVKNES